MIIKLLAGFCVAAATTMLAQPSGLAVADSKAAMKDAFIALKTGNNSAAIQRLQGTVKRGAQMPHEDVQVARRLLMFSASFQNSGDAALGKQVANLALGKVASPEGRMSPKDAAAAVLLEGEIHELWANSSSAKTAYQRALVLDPTLQHAKQRLAHLEAVERLAREKVAANVLLQERAVGGRR